MSKQETRVWHARNVLNINRTLDVRPIGWHERDQEGFNNAQKNALSKEIRESTAKFRGFEPIQIEDVGGPIWAFRRAQSKTDVIPKPAMSLGGFLVVTPECREVLEKVDLGETDFLDLGVMDVPRERVVFPELYLMHVRNAKQSLDIQSEITAGVVSENPGLPRSYGINPQKTPSVSKVALDGPDIWRENQLSQSFGNTIFLSSQLKKLLTITKMNVPWGLQKSEIHQYH